MLNIPEFSLPQLTKYQHASYVRYAKQVLEAQQHMSSPEAQNIIRYTLENNSHHVQMTHYPQGDRIDRDTGAQYFYHCHRENFETEEHGHFHCYLRYPHISKRIKPLPLADWDKNMANPMTHLIAIGMNRYGQPIRLFSVNRWITDEICYEAKHTARFVKQFKMTKTDSYYWQNLDRWVEGMIHLFAPHIQWVNSARDMVLSNFQKLNPDCNVYEEQRFDVLSEMHINLNQHIQWILEFDSVEQPVS